jgi:hypothetical protein
MFNETKITTYRNLKAVENLLALEVAKKTEFDFENMSIFIGVSDKETNITKWMANDLNERKERNMIINDNLEKKVHGVQKKGLEMKM